jgi:hypothetical protein
MQRPQPLRMPGPPVSANAPFNFTDIEANRIGDSPRAREPLRPIAPLE